MTKPLAVQLMIPNHLVNEIIVLVVLAAPVGRGMVALPPQMGLPPEAFQPAPPLEPIQSNGQALPTDNNVAQSTESEIAQSCSPLLP